MSKVEGQRISVGTGFSPEKLLQWLLLLAFVAFFTAFFLHQQNFTNLDQGKLVRYGEEIVGQRQVFSINLFSYTHPDHAFVNHHWGSGVLFYLLHRLGGMDALTLFGALLNLAAFLFLFLHLQRRGNGPLMLLVALFLLPLLASRTQPRPEGFSIFFFAVVITLLYLWYNRMLVARWLWLLPLIQLLWVNIHILFFVGLFLQGTMLLQLMLLKERHRELRFFAMVFLAGVAASFVNPALHEGVLYPMRIMGDIKYAVTENLSLPALRAGFGENVQFYYFELTFLLGAILLWYWVKNPERLLPDLYLVIWIVAFAALFVWRARANVFYGYVLLLAVGHLSATVAPAMQRRAGRIGMAAFATLAAILMFMSLPFYSPFMQGRARPGTGLEPAMSEGAGFVKQHGIAGPVFNNFDVGDYLIYHLYPDIRVFVDSRPEAYPPRFFRDELLPAFESREGWLRLDHAYRFNMVFLAYHSQVLELVKHLYHDDGWFMAYNDDYVIVFLRRGQQNDHLVRHAIIQHRQLPDIVEHFSNQARLMNLFDPGQRPPG